MSGLTERILAILLCACEAEGDALSYEWHFRNKNITEFSKSSTVTLTMCIFITDITIDGSGLQVGGELEVVPEAVSELTLSVKDNTITASCRIAPT